MMKYIKLRFVTNFVIFVLVLVSISAQAVPGQIGASIGLCLRSISTIPTVGHQSVANEFLTNPQLLEALISIYDQTLEKSNEQNNDNLIKIKISKWFEDKVLPILRNIQDNRVLSEDPLNSELSELISEEFNQLTLELQTMGPEFVDYLRSLLDETSSSVMVEFIPTGGHPLPYDFDKLFTMYKNIAFKMGWKLETILNVEGRHVIFKLKGKQVFALMQFESGDHKIVIRGEKNEPGKDREKRQTHFVSVNVYEEPRPDKFEFHERDIKFQTTHSGGPGGQNVNKVETAVHATHLPTGLHVKVEQERTQQANKRLAIEILKGKAYALHKEKIRLEEQQAKLPQNGNGTTRYVRLYDEHRPSDHWRCFGDSGEGLLNELNNRSLSRLIDQFLKLVK